VKSNALSGQKPVYKSNYIDGRHEVKRMVNRVSINIPKKFIIKKKRNKAYFTNSDDLLTGKTCGSSFLRENTNTIYSQEKEYWNIPKKSTFIR